MAANKLGRNIEFPIYNADGTPFHDLVLRKSVVESIVMSLSDKITGDVYYKDNSLETTSGVYVNFKHDFQDANEEPIKFLLVNPPTVVREGHVKDNSELKGMTKYSFTFYHPMYQLSNMPFTDVAVNAGELSYLSEKKEFSWIGKPDDFIAKLNKNLEGTQWIVVKSDRFPTSKNDILSGVLTFNNNTIADALKTEYDTWGEPFIVDVVKNNESGYQNGKRFKIIIGLPANEIYGSQEDEQQENPFVFEFGKGVGLKNNSRTPRNNKIITRISGYGSEDNIPYGYPQIVWNGDEGDERLQYPLYDGIVGGQYVKLIKHPFTRTHLMPSIYSETVNKKVNPNAVGYNPNITLVDYYDAIYSEETPYVNPININAPSYEIHEFDIKPEFNNGGATAILGAVPLNDNLTIAEAWDDTMDDDGNYIQSYFQVTLPPLGFDVYACAAITQEMQINMRSGACIGCTFTVQVDWEQYKANFYNGNTFAPDGEQRDLTLFPNSTSASINLVLKKENTTFGTLMPSVYQHPANGDNFVFLGISLPIEYISNAEERLDDEMKDYMLANNVHYYDYPLKFDEYFLAQNTYILSQLRPNSIVRFLYNDNELQLYVKQLTIKYGDAALPQYDITLTDNVEVVLNQIGQAVEGIEKLSSVLTSVLKQGGGSVNVSLVKSIIETYGTDLFLRKDKESTAAEIIRFLKGIKFGSSNQWYINGDGEAVLNSLNVKDLNALNAHFAQLIIDEIKSVGGQIILTPASCRVWKVTSYTSGGNRPGQRPNTIYRVYFKATDGEKQIRQMFEANDQVICASFNAATGTNYDVKNKFFWSQVISVSTTAEDVTIDGETEKCYYINISNNARMPGCEIDIEPGDELVQLGNTTDETRQQAIIISAYDSQFLDNGYGEEEDDDYVPPIIAPSIVQYAGINDYTLYNKRVNVISYGYNVFKGDFKANTGEDLMETISQIEEGRLSYVHQAWAANAVEKADHGWTLTDWNLNYFSGARFMCLLSDHTQGEAHLNDKSIWESAPQPSANPPIPKKNWVPFNYDISSVDYYYAKTTTGNKPADSAFSSSYPSDISANDYIWTKEVITYSNGLVSTSYSSLRIADDGEAGADGVSSYLHIAYASSADGSQNFSTTPLASSTYIGFYRNEDPTNPSDYTLYGWSRYVGDAGLNGLSAPPAYKETTVPHYLVYASGTGVTKNTTPNDWVDNNAPALTDEKPYLWRYDTTTYENVGGVENLLLDSTNQFNYYAQNGNYIAKIKLAENLVNGNTYSLVFKAEDLSTFTITSCTVDIYLTTAWMAPGKTSSSRHIVQASGLKQEADGTCRVTFTAIAPDSTNKQLALYITGVGLSVAVPEIYWTMLAEGGVQYSWIAAPIDLKKETTPAVVATNGRGIGQIAEYYAKNNSNTTPPSGWQTSPYTGWSTTPVAADSTNMYVWNFEVITYTDGTTVVTTPHVSSGYALGIDTTTVKYDVTSTATKRDDSYFVEADTPPTVNKGQYLWTMTEITYGDGSKTKAYSVSYKATDGTSPYFADIDNEMDSVPCTSAGVTTAAFDKTLNVKMWHGSTEIALTTLSTNTISGITITANKTAKTVRVQVASGTTIAAVNNIAITIAGSGSGNMTLNFTLNGIRAGANGTNGTNGENAVVYNLLPSDKAINVGRDGENYVPTTATLTCGYTKSDGTNITTVADVTAKFGNYNIYHRKRTRSTGVWQTTYYRYYTYKAHATAAYTLKDFSVATYDAVEFIICTATGTTVTEANLSSYTVIDKETIPVVADGEEGNGIKKVTVTYAGSTSGTTAPSSGWQSTIPSVALGNFLWTRSITEYTDTSVSNTTSYGVSRIGADGAQGTPGATGANGQTTYLHIAYANSADGSVNFDTSYFTGASYIGTRTDFDIDDPNDYTKYEWAELRGMDNAGVYVTDVKNYYKVTNTNTTPDIDNTWVLCPPGTIPQPTSAKRFLWNYEVTEYGCQYPNMVLNSDNPTIGGDPYLFRFNSTNEFVHDEVYSFVIKLGQLPSPKTYYCLQIQGSVQKNGETIHNSRAISQSVGQDPTSPTRLVPNEDGIIMGTFKCDIYVDDLDGYIDQTQHVWVSAYPTGGTYNVPSFDWITIVKGTQVASWSKALSELTQTIPPHLIATQGEKGDSAWVADLTNEMDSVQCDDTGYVVSQQSVLTALSLFYGVTEKNFGTPTVKRNGSTITIGTATNGVTVTYSNKVLTVAYDTAAKITGKDEFAITITASEDSSTVRTLTFTVNGIKGDVYNLLPSFEEIKATRDDNGSYVVSGSNIVSLTCGYTKNINGVVTTGTTDLLDDASTTLDLEGRYNIYFRRRNRSTQAYASSGRWYRYTYATYRAYLVQTETEGVTSGGLNIDTYDAVDFVICTNTANYVANASLANVIDRETVYVVADGLKGGKGDYKATVFKRQNTQPSTPTASQGTYSNPVPDGWSDGIPAGGEMVWATTRTFKVDDTSTAWSEPRQMTDTMTYDVEFAYEQPQDATPAAPTDANRHGGSGTQIWFDPALDTDEDYTKMAWRAERECANGVWGDWTIIRIKGEEGGLGLSAPPELTRTVTPYWALSASNTTHPATTSSDWGTSPVAPTAEKKYVWYYTKATYTGEEASRNMLRNSKNQWSYTTRSSIYIAKIRLWESLVAGQTYTITFYVDDLSSLSTGNVTVRTLYNSSASTKIQATIKVHEGNLYKATFTALATTEETQAAIYIGVSGFTATSPETCPKVYWAMLTRGEIAYSWQAAPEDLTESSVPEIRTEKPDAGPQGQQGNAGRGIASGYPKEKYLLSNLNTGVTVAGNTWSDSILTPTEDKPYLWNYEETLWTDNTTTNSTPHILTTYTRAAAGDAFISGVYNWYVVTGQSSGVTRTDPADGTWVKCPPNDTPVPTSEKRYLWNYEETVWDAPEQGRNLIKSFTQSSQYTIAVCTLSTAVTIVQGATYTASIRLNVPSTKNQIRFGWYGKTTSSASNTTHYITELDQSISPGLQTVTVTFVMPTFYTLSSFRVYLNPSNSSYEIAEIEWIKLEKGALPSAYTVAPENLTTYTEPHVVCIHGENGADSEVYMLSPIEEFAGIQFTQNGGINSTNRQLVVGLSYNILKVVGASYEEVSPSSDLYLRLKLTRQNGTSATVGHAFEDQSGNPSTIYTLTTSYTNVATSTNFYTVELVKAGEPVSILDTRVVYVTYIASAAFEIDQKLHEIRSIVQGSHFDGSDGLVRDVSQIRQDANEIESTVQQHTTTLEGIPNTYATQSSVTQTASEIRSQVYGGMVNGANLLLRSKEQESGFDSSLSTAAVQEQTNKYFACFSFGNIKPTGTDTILVSWQQTNVSGLTYRVMLYGKYPSGDYGTFKASGNLTTSANGYYARKFSLEGYTAEKVVIYATATSPSSLTEVAWAKAEFCDADATTADATEWTPAIEETGSEIKQTTDEIIAAVEGTGVSISKKQITLNGDTQINGTLTISNTGDGFMLRSDNGSALITPESIGSYNSFNTTTYTSSPQYHQEVGGFYKESDYYRTIPYSMYVNIGTFSSNSEIRVQNLSFSHFVLTDNYPSVTGTEVGTITFYEGSNEESYPLTTGTTYSYTTSVNGASVGIRISGYFKVASGTTSYTLLDSLKSGNIVTMFGFTLRTPVQGAFVRVASDGLGVNAGNGKTAYFGPDGFHVTPLLQNVKTISANYTASFTDDIIMVNNSSTVTLTLPTNGAIPEGKKIYVKKMTNSSTLRVQATYGSSGMIYKCNSASAVAYEDSTSPVMTYYISFDTGSGIGWLQGYCG